MTQKPTPFLSLRKPVCPPELLQLARMRPKPRVIIARAGGNLPMQAAKEATEAGIMLPMFTGERDDILRAADTLEWDIADYPLLETKGEEEAGLIAASACGAGDADVLMKGQIPSDLFLKTALNRSAGLRSGNRLVHIFHITHPDGGKPLLVSDAAVNVSPDIQTRRACTTAVIDLLAALGNNNPKIAFLSASEKPLPSMPSAVEARELQIWAQQQFEHVAFSGPLALDLILSRESAAIKGLHNDPVAGDADAIIVPDIVSGNAVFKSLVYLSGGCAGGLITGARVPLLLTSRSDPPAARLASIALAGIARAALAEKQARDD